jgi:hypothetical protein
MSEKSIVEVLPILKAMVEEGIYSSLEEAVEEFKIRRERVMRKYKKI